MGGLSIVRRSLLLPLLFSSSIQSTPQSSPFVSSFRTLASQITRPILTSLLFNSSSVCSPDLFFSAARSHCSSAGTSNIVIVESDEELNNLLKQAEDNLPTIFYFTAVWCGPCRFVSPYIEELSKKYPHVKTYKVDIDKEGLANTLSKLNISSVPTFHFFQNGKRATEIIGADVDRIESTMEELYSASQG